MRNFFVSIYLVKAAELDIIRKTAIKLLRGLNFTAVYTPHFAMCTDSLSEILLATNATVAATRSVMRFSCSGLFPKQEMNSIRAQMDECICHAPDTVSLWCKSQPVYFEKAATKANNSLQKTLKEISCRAGDSFNLLIINNDNLPMFELLASKECSNLEVAHPGEVIQFRYEVVIAPQNIISWRLVHAFNLK